MEYLKGKQESGSASVGNQNERRGRGSVDDEHHGLGFLEEPEQRTNGGGDFYLPRMKVEFPRWEGGD